MLKTFVFLATLYTSDGPVIYVLDENLSGADCIERMHVGVTRGDVLAVLGERVTAAGEGHVPAAPLDLAGAVLSCEFTW